MKLESVAVVGTFFSLWLAVIFADTVEHILAYIFILTFGILHGANDLTLIQKGKPTIDSNRNYIKILLFYILFVLGSIFIFYLFPSLALFVFVLFSGFHFGEQHFVAKTVKPSLLSGTLYFLYGTFILFLLFFTNDTVTIHIIETITGYTLLISVFKIGLTVTGIGTLCLGILLVLKNSLKINPVKEIFFLGVFFIVFKTASLIWGFAIYFILWHSIPSLYDQIFYLHGQMNMSAFKSFVKNSFPYWLISVIGLVILLFSFRDNLETSLAFFFSFLAAITFPHVLVITQLNQDQN